MKPQPWRTTATVTEQSLACDGSSKSRSTWEAALLDFAGRIAREDDERSVMTAMVDGLVELLGAQSAHAYIVDESREELRLRAHRNTHEVSDAHAVRIALDAPEPVTRAVKSPSVVIVDDDGGGARATAGAIVALPLVARSRVVGALRAAWPTGLDARNAEHLETLPALLGALLDRALARAEIADRHRAHAAQQFAERDREMALAQLTTEQRWLRTMIEVAPIGIVLFEGPRADRVVMNPFARAVLGDEIVRQVPRTSARYFLYPDGSPVPEEDVLPARVLRGEVVIGEERLVRRPDGVDVHVLVHGGPVRDDRGELLGAMLLFDDISALKKLQRLREEWTHVVAHDLTQPLCAIQMHAALVKRHAPGTLRSSIAHIESSTQLLARMIADLEDLSILETQRVPLTVSAIDLAALLSSVAQRAAARMPSRALRVEARGTPPLVTCDPQRIEQVVANLISNADKYGYATSEIVVTLEVSGPEAIIAVINEGEGIPADEQTRVFERFHRLPGAHRGKSRGLGLGLYISKGFVEAHGGRIWIESEAKQKTRVCFTLPIAPRASEPGPLPGSV